MGGWRRCLRYGRLAHNGRLRNDPRITWRSFERLDDDGTPAGKRTERNGHLGKELGDWNVAERSVVSQVLHLHHSTAWVYGQDILGLSSHVVSLFFRLWGSAKVARTLSESSGSVTIRSPTRR